MFCPTGIDIRDGVQLECINCGLCVDACNHVMEKVGSPPWLITWDTLAGQKARARGTQEPWHFLRPRTMLYASLFAAGCGTLAYGLVTRSTMNFSAIHDRAPLFVRLRDGSVRNGYTVKLANKTQAAANYTLRVRGLQGALLGLPEQSPGLAPVLHLMVPASAVGTFRLVLKANDPAAPGGRQSVTLQLQDDAGQATLTYRALFFSPDPGRRGGWRVGPGYNHSYNPSYNQGVSDMAAMTVAGWRHFPRYMIAAMLLVFAVNVRFIVIAVSSFPGAASNDDFDTSNRYNAVLAAAAAQDALGWTEHLSAPGRAPVLDLAGPGGALAGAVVTATAERPLGQSEPIALTFHEAAPAHYASSTVLPLKGQYDLRLRIVQGGHEVRVTRRVLAP